MNVQKLNPLQRRVRDRLKQLGRGPVEVAIEVGLERNFLHDLVTGKKSSIGNKNIHKVADALDWTASDVLGQSVARTGDDLEQETRRVPEMEVRGGAAYAGGVTQEEAAIDEFGHPVSRDAVRAHWSIPLPFLREEMRLRAGRANILPVRGDSMNDALYDGDRVLIDLDDTDIAQGGIFALVDDNGSVIIKQVEWLRAGEGRRLLCTSRNTRYKPFELDLSETVKIIGRVACKITRL